MGDSRSSGTTVSHTNFSYLSLPFTECPLFLTSRRKEVVRDERGTTTDNIGIDLSSVLLNYQIEEGQGYSLLSPYSNTLSSISDPTDPQSFRILPFVRSRRVVSLSSPRSARRGPVYGGPFRLTLQSPGPSVGSRGTESSPVFLSQSRHRHLKSLIQT